MANRMFNQFQGTLEKGVVQLWAEITFAASGAPTLVRGKGVAAIEKLATGQYGLKLQDSYVHLLGFSAMWENSSGSIDALVTAPFVQLRSTTDVTDVSAPYVKFNVATTAGVLSNPATTETLYLAVTLSNSTAL